MKIPLRSRCKYAEGIISKSWRGFYRWFDFRTWRRLRIYRICQYREETMWHAAKRRLAVRDRAKTTRWRNHRPFFHSCCQREEENWLHCARVRVSRGGKRVIYARVGYKACRLLPPGILLTDVRGLESLEEPLYDVSIFVLKSKERRLPRFSPLRASELIFPRLWKLSKARESVRWRRR